jgi:maltose O-acetyltransferase
MYSDLKRGFLALVSRAYEPARARWRGVLAALYRPRFAAHGENFWFDPMGQYSFSTISVGEDVSLGERACLIASRSRILIGSHVMFGPEVTIRGGNHRTDVVGRLMKSIRDEEKRPEDDRGVVIEDDVWVGARAVILSGVRIGRGAVVGAGAIVTKSIPPYAIVVGNPARLLRFRWDVKTILDHERLLYPESERLTREFLEACRVETRNLTRSGAALSAKPSFQAVPKVS